MAAAGNLAIASDGPNSPEKALNHFPRTGTKAYKMRPLPDHVFTGFESADNSIANKQSCHHLRKRIGHFFFSPANWPRLTPSG